MTIYGYCRISRKSQNIERQVRNIKEAYKEAVIFQEAYTGTKLQGRKELDKLLQVVKAKDVIVFDSASRMSRNAEEAMVLYEDLYKKGIQLVFLKEPHINTETFKQAMETQINVDISTGKASTDAFVNSLFEALNKLIIDIAKDQIRLVFNQAQKEVDDLHQRTKEGMITAKANGKQIGLPAGTKLETKKAKDAKKKIKKLSKDFNGSLADVDVIKVTGISRNSYYKYKKEMFEELAN